MLVNVEGIVIRSMDYGEGNKIVTLYTKQAGKMSVMVRGAKKMNSRHAAITQLFSYGEFIIYKTGQMGTLNQGELLKSYQPLREDLHKAAYSSYLVELIDRMVGDQERNETLFEQLRAALSAIEEGKDAMVVLHIMEMKMLALSGYLPELSHCVSCGTDQGEMALSISQGGLVCRRCRTNNAVIIAVSEVTLKLLRLFQRVDLRRLGTTEVKAETKAQLKQCMRSFIDMHMDVRWKSRSFLDQMDKYNI